jgi:hypothetical protein
LFYYPLGPERSLTLGVAKLDLIQLGITRNAGIGATGARLSARNGIVILHAQTARLVKQGSEMSIRFYGYSASNGEQQCSGSNETLPFHKTIFNDYKK